MRGSRLAAATERLATRIEGASALDPVTERLHAVWSTLLPNGPVRDLLSGTWLGHPLHPAAILLPAGSLLSVTVLDVSGGDLTARQRLTAVGLASAAPAAIAGWSDWLDTEQAEKRLGLVHAATNIGALVSYGVAARSRRRGGSGLTGSLTGATLLAAGGWLGGHLAYAQGVGVDTTAFMSGPDEWTAVATVNAVTAEAKAVTVRGVPVLLVRDAGGTARALFDRCTHRGAPLSDGAVVDDCIVCPWHDSAFALDTGAVVRGPATRPQAEFEVRERDGQIEIRRSEQRSLRVNPTGSGTS